MSQGSSHGGAARRPRSGDLFDHALDLLVGSSCLGCRRAGRLLCPACLASLPSAPRLSWPSPTPAGLAEPWAAGPYDGLLRRLVIEHKEESRFGLGAPLGQLMAGAVASALASVVPGPIVAPGLPGPPGLPRVLLVPVPSRPGVVRRRGDDPTRRVVRGAARVLARHGLPVTVAGALRSHRGVLDQAGLDAAARAGNLAGSMWVPIRWRRSRDRDAGREVVIVCDDVLTTGSTVREAQRALSAAGVEVSAIAVVAAVRRRHRPVEAS